MKKLLFTLLLCPLFSTAQTNQPRFEKDTLTTTGGYKIYKGQVLQFANGTSDAGYFRFVKFHHTMIKNNTYILQNSTVLVKNLKGYKFTGPEENNIRIIGTATFADGKQEEVVLLMNFERAINGSDGLPPELIVPEAFKNSQSQTGVNETKDQPKPAGSKKQKADSDIKKLMVADEIKKLFDLYQAGALTKEEYETQKKKIIDRQ